MLLPRLGYPEFPCMGGAHCSELASSWPSRTACVAESSLGEPGVTERPPKHVPCTARGLRAVAVCPTPSRRERKLPTTPRAAMKASPMQTCFEMGCVILPRRWETVRIGAVFFVN